MYSSKSYDQNGLYQVIVDLSHFDCMQLWRDEFIDNSDIKKATLKSNTNLNKRTYDDSIIEDKNCDDNFALSDVKRRRTSAQIDASVDPEYTYTIDR